MARVIILMIEVEQPEGLSARKLVLETSKHNVLTAYDGASGVSLLKRFPDVDAVVIHTHVQNPGYEETVRRIREIRSDVPLIVLSPSGLDSLPDVNYVIPSHEPQALLMVLADHFNASTKN